MTTEEIEESQSGVEDGGVGGPGAPTPLSALEVSLNGRRASGSV
jgi:DNA repair protein RAD51